MKSLGYLFVFFCISTFNPPAKTATIAAVNNNAVVYTDTIKPSAQPQPAAGLSNANITTAENVVINNGTTPQQLVAFSKTLIGVPYKYASTDPATGFDCSGFITYTFNHFGIKVPRSSVDFTCVGKEVTPANAKEGDLILFTGTVDSIRIVGHMGIVTENTDTLRFIHSTSGRAMGVTISALNIYYQKRLMKVIRVFAD